MCFSGIVNDTKMIYRINFKGQGKKLALSADADIALAMTGVELVLSLSK